MAYSLSNNYAKFLCKQTVLVQLIVEGMVAFFGTRCTVYFCINLICLTDKFLFAVFIKYWTGNC